jgi:subtilase family serine protease
VINGNIVVRNSGNRSSPPSRVRFFLCGGPGFDPSRSALLQEVAISGLRAGASTRAELQAPLGLGEDAIGLYVAVVIDPANDVPEANEKNNTVAPRKIP